MGTMGRPRGMAGALRVQEATGSLVGWELPDDKLVSIGVAARLLGVHRVTVRRLAERGVLSSERRRGRTKPYQWLMVSLRDVQVRATQTGRSTAAELVVEGQALECRRLVRGRRMRGSGS
jgi:excisionase family DNA binding protein